jgi:peptidoglycan-associated lipoprotein
MNRGWISRTVVTLLALVLMLALAAGCGKKAEVETDPAANAGQEAVEELPPPPAPEDKTEPVETALDYTNMEPADFGVEDVYFAFDEYDLDNDAMAILSRNARILREAGVMILISGHTDERGTVEYNLALGERRALAVKDYLVSLGVSASKLRITSYGENSPFAYGSTEDAWAQNRRSHFERP